MSDLLMALLLLATGVLAGGMAVVMALNLAGGADDPLLDLMTPLDGPDYTWIGPAHECLCGCGLFHALVAFDEGEIVYYVLEGICHSCGGKVTLPCPLDHATGGA